MHYDIVIIGTGAGGGTMAHALAPSGKRILILERGDFLTRERENWDPHAVFEEKRYLAKETWYDKHDQPFSPYTHYCVGGNTKVYGAALLRMRESDFEDVQHYGGVSPAWPISYDDLEPYYTLAERLYHVHGERGSDPHEPLASGPFPFPALPPEPRMKELFDDIKALGLKPFPMPLGIRLSEREPGASAYSPSTFDGYPDPTESKADAHVIGIKSALRFPNVTLLTRTRVDRLHTDRTGGEVTQIEAVRDGEQLIFKADVVILAAGAINSAALLLRSADAKHPRGLANSSDQVGRNYMTHQNGCFLAVTQTENLSRFQKHFAISDFYRATKDHDKPLGLIQLMGKPDRGTIQWLRADKLPDMTIEHLERRTIDFFLTAEDLPSPDNRITLRPDGSVRVSYTINNARAYDQLEANLTRILTQVESARGRRSPVILSSRLGVSGVSHQNGTLRFGDDPTTSVLDVDCKAHDLNNLYVVDGSFFRSSSAVNPSLTIIANALRVSERILDRMGVSAGHSAHAGGSAS